MNYNNKYLENQIEKSYIEYLSNHDLSKMMEAIYFLYKKELLYFCTNEDIIHNFLLEFFESILEKVLENYKKRQDDISLLPYLKNSIKFSFFTYLKKHKIQLKFDKSKIYLSDNVSYKLSDPDENTCFNSYEDFWFKILEFLNDLPIYERILFKFYYDLKLNSEELKYLIIQYGFKKVKNFLNHYSKLREKNIEKNNLNEYNANYFYTLNIINNENPDDYLYTEYKKIRYNFYKRRYSRKTIPSAVEIGKFLGIKKNNLYNKMYKIRQKIYSKILNQKTFYHEYYCA
ncbi:MAG: hypothetical protein KatS3mg129_1887 [Leptospiraceae bacterium]|nr:MAG: hypothetical protein KatS3mg129_1887 [Leptospiraceae bacterium]